jgi:hypothetical protein
MRKSTKKINKKIPKIAPNDIVKKLALAMALHCVRNTVIEDYHTAGKLTDEEMAIFNKEVANKIYSIMYLLYNPKYTPLITQLFSPKIFYTPSNWDSPEFDEDFLKIINKIDKKIVIKK